jgi:hypothetical protein
MSWTQRYKQAHNDWVKQQSPAYYEAAGGNSMKVSYPCVTKSNGLTSAICKYLEWSGHRATRINTAGRIVNGRYITSTTRKGTADISATIKGRAIMIEIKVGKDRPSEYQLAEQQRERNAGGIYEFIHSIDEFFLFYDNFILILNK